MFSPLQRRLERVHLLQPEQLVDVEDRRGLRAARRQVLGERVHHQVGLLQQREEVGILHAEQLPAGRGRREHRVAVLLRERHHREVRAGAPRRQDQVDLVAAHQLLVGAHDRLGVAAVVEAHELDLALHALDVQPAGGVHLLRPHDVVRLLRDLRARGPRTGARDRVADAYRLLGERRRDRREGERRRRDPLHAGWQFHWVSSSCWSYRPHPAATPAPGATDCKPDGRRPRRRHNPRVRPTAPEKQRGSRGPRASPRLIDRLQPFWT